MPPDQSKVPVSARITAQAKKILDKAAQESDKSLSSLIAIVLEDYASWLERKPD